MKVLAALAALLAFAAFPAAAFQGQPACAPPFAGPGKALAFPGLLSEDQRAGLLAGVFLALKDPSGRGAWPSPQIEAAPPCAVASFNADGVSWTISGGGGEAPPRWISTPGREDYFFVAAGPGLEDARAWNTARASEVTLNASPAYYLTGAAGDSHFVFRIYDAPPSSRQIADALVDVIGGKTAPLAVYDPQGDAVSLFLPTANGRMAELFRPGLIHSGRTATLYAPDGAFFIGAPDAVEMRGSGLLCADRYGPLSRARLIVLDTRDETLDLGCRLETADAWISVFSTRLPNADDDKDNFARRLKQAQAEGGVSGRGPADPARRTPAMGKAWLDKEGTGQGLWFVRRGEFVIEVRATFKAETAAIVFDALAALAANTVPDNDIGEGPA